MPFLAILLHEWRGLWSGWLVRLWLIAAILGGFLFIAGNWEKTPTAEFIAWMLTPYLVFPWFVVVIMLGISPITGTRLDALADGILSRPVTRYEYLLAAWAARVAVVLTVYLAVVLPAVILVTTASRTVQNDVTFYGVVAALSVVALVLTFLVSLAFLTGTVLRRPMVAALVLVFVWYPISFVMHQFSLEEFSPISLNQSLPTLMRTPWGETVAANDESMSAEDLQRMVEATNFISVLAGSPASQPREENFFDRGEYEDFSLFRVVLGYGIPTIAAIALATLCFCWRDL
jgi:ABC-type transport system involved in multi-copper enzyme maturation permease subunit